MLIFWTVILLAGALGRELSSDELITEPKPGEEYVHIQTGQPAQSAPVKLEDTSFQTSHHVPKKPRQFQTAHVRPADLPVPEESSVVETRVPLEVVTSTSVKSSKSKKVHRKAENLKKPLAPKKSNEESQEFDAVSTIMTEEPPITTFSYKTTEEPSATTYHPTDRSEEVVATTFTYKKQDKSSEALNTAETRAQQFDIVPVNKQSVHRSIDLDSDDFVDGEEKVPAGTSNAANSRVNVKKGPNGQDYEYEYVYYYYDDDDDNSTAPVATAPANPTASPVRNSHDAPAPPTSTGGNRYLPTEAPHSTSDELRKVQYTTINRNPEQNEVLPSTAIPSRGRGRPIPAEPVAEERLPANTRFPPRGRAQGASATATPAPTTTSTTSSPQSRPRVRLPTLGLLDSSSFKTHASDASVEDDIYRQGPNRPSADIPETTIRSRGSRPTTPIEAPVEQEELFTRRHSRPTTPAPEISDSEEQVFTRRSSRVTTPSSIPTDKEQVFTRRSSRINTPSPVSDDEQVITRRGGRITTSPAPAPVEEDDVEQEVSVQNARRPETSRQVDEEEGTDLYNNGPARNTQEPPTSEMQKAAFDLYAILQQAQNENIHSNLIDPTQANTEPATEAEILETTSPATTSSTTTTTTTEATTTTTTTTTEPPPSAPARGNRYRGRGPVRPRSSTTEATVEVSSVRSRPRFHSPSNRIGSRRISKEPAAENTVAEAAVEETSERHFGGKSRTRTKPTAATTTTTTASPDGASSSPARGSSLDRYKNNRRRRPGPADTATTASEAVSSTASPRSPSPVSTRTRPGVRPLRPGVRLPLGSTTTTTTEEAPSAPETAEGEQEAPAPVVEKVEEEPVVTTPAGDALTRLKARPRLRVHAASPHKSTTSSPPAARRQLVSSLLPKRNKPAPAAAVVEAAPEAPAEVAVEEEQEATDVPVEAPSSPAPTEAPKGLPGLLAGRRRPLNRRPGSIYRPSGDSSR